MPQVRSRSRHPSRRCPIVWILAILVLAVLVWAAWVFNRLVGLRNRLKAAWGDIDALLKRRADLIPNLVAAVKGYASHEERVFTEVTEARAGAEAAAEGEPSPRARSEAENRLTRRVHRLIALAEDYPELRASANFLDLQAELTGTENDIAHARRYYNAVIRDYETERQRFPAVLIAGLLGFGPREYFELSDLAEREAPDVGAPRE